MATERHLAAVAQPPTDSAQPAPPSGVPTSEALASFLRHLATRRAPEDGTARSGEFDKSSRRRRMT